MSDELKGKRIAIIAADGVERVELEQPRDAVQAAGASTELISLQAGEIQAMDHDLEPSTTFPVDKAIGDASVGDYDGLILPGGVANPDNLRVSGDVIAFLQAFFKSGKPVGVICHGPWTLVEADLVRGRTLTSYPSIRTDIRNAGGNVLDEEVVVDQGLVSSRDPTTCPRSAPRSSRSSPKASTRSRPRARRPSHRATYGPDPVLPGPTGGR